MTQCRFENRLTNEALELEECVARFQVRRPEELCTTLQQIEAAQQSGYWVALLIDYELGEWLDPALSHEESTAGQGALLPRLTALVFRNARKAPVWMPPACAAPPPLHPKASIDKTRYLADIIALREGIARGDYYQVNYTFDVQVYNPLSPRELYCRLAAAHPSAHAAFIDDGERQLLSLSPELFVRRQGTQLTVRPMKGTAARHPDPTKDWESGQTLLASEKNRAENLMIVDLLRNDLGRIAVPGSVKVDALFTLEHYPSVWTLTSTIHAECPPLSLHALLHALFPCGSITGAPKLAAMQAIRKLEQRQRGIYCGSIGWLAPNGDFSLNVAIRTLEFHGGHVGRYGVGGGIVHDSDPELEWQECLWKARIINLADHT